MLKFIASIPQGPLPALDVLVVAGMWDDMP
jgi:hypothetical protein